MIQLPKNKISISISISFDLLSEIDKAAFLSNKTRSKFIVSVLKEKLKSAEEKENTENEEITEL